MDQKNITVMNIAKQSKWRTLIYLFPLCSTYLFGATFIDLNTVKALYFGTIAVFSLIFFKGITNIYISDNTRCIRNIILCFFATIFCSYILWSQSFSLGFRSTAPILALLYYFILLKSGIDSKAMIKVVHIYTIIWVAVWAFMLFTPNRLFGIEADNRGVQRFFIPGDGFVYLSYFLLFEKWLKTKSIITLLIVIGLFAVIIFQVTRQTIIFTLLVSLYFLFRNNKYIVLCIIAAFFVLQFFTIHFSDDSALGALINLSQNQVSDSQSGDTYIRILEYEYFCLDFNNNPLAILFGNGVPHDESAYGKEILYAKDYLAFYMSDVGYAALYVQFGCLGLLLYFRYFWNLCKSKISNGAAMFLYYILAVNTMSFIFMQNIVMVAIAMYLVELEEQEDNTTIQ